jgi:N-formylglutamate deformylase
VIVPPFERFDPSDREESPVVVEVPHAGLHVDPITMAHSLAPVRSVARDADLYVDRIFAKAAHWGATLLVARWSRHVLDLNRAPDEYDASAVEGGRAINLPRGLVWRMTTDGDPILAKRLDRHELQRRIEQLYEPYHAELRRILEAKRARFGHAVLLCAHSMPTEGRRGGAPHEAPRADVVPGTQGRTTAAGRYIDCVDETARSLGFSVRHDEPYRGGFSTRAYGRPVEGWHAVQIELARRLYMNESTLVPDARAGARVASLAERIVRGLGAIAP